MTTPVVAEPGGKPSSLPGPFRLFLAVFAAVSCAIALVGWLAWLALFRGEITPVVLSGQEQRVLSEKLARFEHSGNLNLALSPEDRLPPEPYGEDDAAREIIFSEREINGLLAQDPAVAQTLMIRLSDSMATARLLVPLDQEIPLLGGKTLKVSAGVEVGYANDRPVVRLKGVSVWGVPLPNAWLGNLKGVDLVREFGSEGGFWETFSAGIAGIEIEKGRLKVLLRD